MLSVEAKRAAIASVYTGDRWKDRVARMDDNQVIVIFKDFQARDLIGRVVSYEPPKGIDRLTEVTDQGIILGFDEAIAESQTRVVQLSVKDILKEKF